MNALDLLVLAVATWRLTSFLVNEAGPFNLGYKIRQLVGIRYDEQSVPYGTNTVAEMLLCVWCTSFWIGVILGGVHLLAPTVAFYIALPFALSGMAILFQVILDRLERE